MKDRDWGSRLGGFCFGLLLAALMVYFAVRLIESILLPLAAIASVVVIVTGLVRVWCRRERSSRW